MVTTDAGGRRRHGERPSTASGISSVLEQALRLDYRSSNITYNSAISLIPSVSLLAVDDAVLWIVGNRSRLMLVGFIAS